MLLRLLPLALLPFLLASCASPLDDEVPMGSNGPAVMRIADTMQNQGQPDMAAQLYRRASELMPKNAEPELRLARVLARYNQGDAAVPHFEEALKRSPGSGEVHYEYGRVLLLMDKPEEALTQFTAAQKAMSRDPKTNNALGATLDQMQRHEEAQGYYRRALENGADPFVTNPNLARSLMYAGKPEAAVKLLEPLKDNTKTTPGVREVLAMAYDRTGRSADAQRLLEKDMPPAEAASQLASWRGQQAALGKYTAGSEGGPAVAAAPVPAVVKAWAEGTGQNKDVKNTAARVEEEASDSAYAERLDTSAGIKLSDEEAEAAKPAKAKPVEPKPEKKAEAKPAPAPKPVAQAPKPAPEKAAEKKVEARPEPKQAPAETAKQEADSGSWSSWETPIQPRGQSFRRSPASKMTQWGNSRGGNQKSAVPKPSPAIAAPESDVGDASASTEAPAPHLNLGQFTTPGMAEGRIGKARKALGSSAPRMAVQSDVSPTGSPRFHVVSENLEIEQAQNLCKTLEGKNIPCMVMTGTR